MNDPMLNHVEDYLKQKRKEIIVKKKLILWYRTKIREYCSKFIY